MTIPAVSRRIRRVHVPSGRTTMRVAWVYDIDGCRGPTGVTRHALAQLERLAGRSDVDLRAISGRIQASEGLIYWEGLGSTRRAELPLGMRNALRVWRTLNAPPLEWWSGPIDWAYSPSDYFLVTTKTARKAVTCHDILQDLKFGSDRRKALIARTYDRADLVLSVSKFNTERLIEAFPRCADKVALVPNAADDLFFEPTTEPERVRIREDLGLPPALPYLLSVANFQARKNLPRLIRAAGRLPLVANGELALALLGDGDEPNTRAIREAIASIGPKAVVTLPGYRQGPRLRAAYAEAEALVFPSTCESFGIPAVEAMAQGTPVALADSTALPEIAGEAGWYFDPERDDAITHALQTLLDSTAERSARVRRGLDRARTYRWRASSDLLIQALRQFR